MYSPSTIYFRMFFANEIKNLKLLLDEVNLEEIFDEAELAAFKHARPNIVDNLHVPVGRRKMQTARLKKVVGPNFDIQIFTEQVLQILRRGTEIRIGKILFYIKIDHYFRFFVFGPVVWPGDW